MKHWIALGRAAALGCALIASGSMAGEPAEADQCGLALPSHFVGARAEPSVRRAIRALARPRLIRWITPGQVIQADFNALRLNVILDETGRITAMRCG